MKKLIFITGASSGIGYEVSKEFSRQGWNVISSARRINLLNNLANTCKSYRGDVFPLKLDITDTATLKKKIYLAIKKYGIPDIIFLNAGTNNPNSKEILSVEETKKIFNINFFSVIECISIFLPIIKKKKNCQIIIMSSVAGYRGLPYASAYCSSKSALTSFTESIFNQCKQIGVNLRLVNPGFVKTPLTDKNNFPMPMIITAKKASKILYKKFIFSKKFEINLPIIFCLIMKFLRILPYSIYFKITNKLLKSL